MSQEIKVYEMPVQNPGKPESRWPFTHNPKSWYMIEYSENLAIGDVKPVQYFGQHLVLFRGEDGKATLLDAYCPHMGAHLGHGGVVEGNEIRCPFHAWKLDGTGTCTEVPYATKIPKRAKIRSWDVCEINGLIMAWCNEEGTGPEWEIPAIDEVGNDEWTAFEKYEWVIPTHNIEMGENQVDTAHFQYLHGVTDMPESKVTIDGPIMHARSETGMETPQGIISSVIDSKSWGFGFQRTRFSGITDMTIVSSTTPMDGENVHVRFNFMVKKVNGVNAIDGVGRAFIDEVARQLEQDIPIWRHKLYIKPPNLCDGDGPVAEYRRWCKQFFPGGTF